MKRRRISFAFLAPICLAGCATLEPRESFPGLADDIEMRTGSKVAWRDGSESDRAVDEAIDKLLAHDLSADSAVQIALLNNRSIQSTYEELGIAQAELVEAGLLSNPIFSALLKFPDGGGHPKIELAISQNFIELLSMPLRKRMASAKYDSTKSRVANDVVELAARVRKAFVTAQADQQSLALQRLIARASESSSLAAQRLRSAGNITELQLAKYEAEFGQAHLELMQAESRSMKAGEELTELMGLWGERTDFTLAALPELPREEANLEDIELKSIRESFELQSSICAINAARESLGIARQFSWGDLEASIEAEREVEGDWLIGPGVSVPIPIFDTGAANVSIARAQLRQAEHGLYAVMVRIRSEARAAKFDLLKAREQVEFHQSTILPLRQRIVRQSQLQYNAMQIGVFELLEARRAELEANRAYVESLRDYWLARAELERLVGIEPTELQTSSTQPATQSAIETFHQHHH